MLNVLRRALALLAESLRFVGRLNCAERKSNLILKSVRFIVERSLLSEPLGAVDQDGDAKALALRWDDYWTPRFLPQERECSLCALNVAPDRDAPGGN